MANLHIKAPDGKTLTVAIPDGTEPAQYDSMAQEALDHYAQHPSTSLGIREEDTGATPMDEFRATAALPSMLTDTGGEKTAEVVGEAGYPKTGAAIGTGIQMLPDIAAAAGAYKPAVTGANAIARGVGAMGESLASSGSTVADALKSGWNAMRGNTPRAFGFAQAAGETPAARQAAMDAIKFANTPQPELGAEVANVAGAPVADAEQFTAPVRQGVIGLDTDGTLKAVESQRNTIGQSIRQLLGKYDNSGMHYDPLHFNEAVKQTFYRDAEGDVMTTGPQGRINAAIKDAASSMNDYARGGLIKWSDAADIKTMGQGDAVYSKQGLDQAQKAYNDTIRLLKDDIDNQASAMLTKQGGDIQQYQTLREGYGKLASLEDSLNVAARRKFANSAIPWWVKMGAGAALGSGGAAVVKGLTGH